MCAHDSLYELSKLPVRHSGVSARVATIARAIRLACRSSPSSAITRNNSRSSARATKSAADSPRVGSMRMSSGPSLEKLNPREGRRSAVMTHRDRVVRRERADRDSARQRRAPVARSLHARVRDADPREIFDNRLRWLADRDRVRARCPRRRPPAANALCDHPDQKSHRHKNRPRTGPEPPAPRRQAPVCAHPPEFAPAPAKNRLHPMRSRRSRRDCIALVRDGRRATLTATETRAPSTDRWRFPRS